MYKVFERVEKNQVQKAALMFKKYSGNYNNMCALKINDLNTVICPSINVMELKIICLCIKRVV